MSRKGPKKMNKRIKKYIVCLLALTMLMTGCEPKQDSSKPSPETEIAAEQVTEPETTDIDRSESNTIDAPEHITTAVQQIMIGTKCSSYDKALQTLLSIKEAGYEAIELNDFMIQKTSIMVKLLTKFSGMPVGNGGKLDWPKLIEESGLKVVSLHSNLGAIEADPKAIAEKAKSFGTDIVVITGMYRFDYSSLEEVENLAQSLNEAGKALLEENVRLLYHNHNCELQKVSPDKTAYDILIEQTDPAYVNFEFDSYWMTDGGANVPALMKKLGTRMKLWHINDRGCAESGPYMTPILKENATELGYGNMDLDTLSAIAIANGVEGVILETHKNWVDKNPIKSLQVSADYMQKMFGGR